MASGWNRRVGGEATSGGVGWAAPLAAAGRMPKARVRAGSSSAAISAVMGSQAFIDAIERSGAPWVKGFIVPLRLWRYCRLSHKRTPPPPTPALMPPTPPPHNDTPPPGFLARALVGPRDEGT